MMNNCENQTTLIGYIVLKPEQISDNPLGVRTRLATNETFYSKKFKKVVTQSEYHNLKIWNKSAKFALDNLTVGDKVYILGKLHYNEIQMENQKLIKIPEIIVLKLIKI